MRFWWWFLPWNAQQSWFLYWARNLKFWTNCWAQWPSVFLKLKLSHLSCLRWWSWWTLCNCIWFRDRTWRGWSLVEKLESRGQIQLNVLLCDVQTCPFYGTFRVLVEEFLWVSLEWQLDDLWLGLSDRTKPEFCWSVPRGTDCFGVGILERTDGSRCVRRNVWVVYFLGLRRTDWQIFWWEEGLWLSRSLRIFWCFCLSLRRSIWLRLESDLSTFLLLYVSFCPFQPELGRPFHYLGTCWKSNPIWARFDD